MARSALFSGYRDEDAKALPEPDLSAGPFLQPARSDQDGRRESSLNEASQKPDEQEVSPGFVHEKLQGWIPELATEQELREALEKAFEYRGDVTITRKDGTRIEGYVYDRREAKHLPPPWCASFLLTAAHGKAFLSQISRA